MFWAAIVAEVETIRRRVDKNPLLIPRHYEYRTPLYFAV